MKTAFYYLVMGAAIILPGAFVLVFIALARQYYRHRRAHGKVIPWRIHKAIP